MMRLLLASTAVAALLATSVAAQDTSSSAPADTSASSSMASSMESSAAPSEASSAPAAESSAAPSEAAGATGATTSRAPIDIASGYTTVDTDRLATKIIGQPVYDSTGDDANNLGNIKDLVLDENGQVAAVVIGVGGFLGIGEKQVAVDFSALQFEVAADNTERYVLQATKEQLTAAPDFQTVEDNPANPSGPAGAQTDTGGALTSSAPPPAEGTPSDTLAPSSAAQ